MVTHINAKKGAVAGLDRLQDFYLSNPIGNPLDTTIAAAQLIFSGVLEKYPVLFKKFLFRHHHPQP